MKKIILFLVLASLMPSAAMAYTFCGGTGKGLISSGDTTCDYGEDNLTADSGMAITKQNGGANESLLFSSGSYQRGHVVTGNYTVGTDDWRECYGGRILVEANATITGCDNLSQGMNFAVIVNAGNYTVTVNPQSDNYIYLDGVLKSIGVGSTNNSTNGDLINCVFRDTTHMVCISGSVGGTGLWVSP